MRKWFDGLSKGKQRAVLGAGVVVCVATGGAFAYVVATGSVVIAVGSVTIATGDAAVALAGALAAAAKAV